MSQAEAIVERLSFVSRTSWVYFLLTGLMVASLVLTLGRKTDFQIRRKVSMICIVLLIVALWGYDVYGSMTVLVRSLYANYFYLSLTLVTIIAVVGVYWLSAVLLLPTLIWFILLTIYVGAKIRLGHKYFSDSI